MKNALYLKKARVPSRMNDKKQIAVDIYFLLSNQSARKVLFTSLANTNQHYPLQFPTSEGSTYTIYYINYYLCVLQAYDMGASKTAVGFIFSVYPLIGFFRAQAVAILVSNHHKIDILSLLYV